MAHPGPSDANQEPYKAKNVSRIPRILLAACGTAAAVGFTEICNYVKVVATRAALHFLDKPSLPKDVALYTDENEWFTWKRLGDKVLHTELQKWADIMVIAPASANTLAKIAGGFCDNLLTCIVRCWGYNKLIFVAPDMNHEMWSNSLTERHVLALDELGICLVPPATVSFADRKYVTGCMDDPSHINFTVKSVLSTKGKSSRGVNSD